MSDDKPPDKDTVKFEPPPKWAEQMFTRVHEQMSAGFSGVDTRLSDAEVKLDKCVSGLGTVTNEVNTMKSDYYQFKGEIHARLDSNSMRAQAQSVHDDEQDHKLAQLSESQMASLLKEIAKTPLGQKLVNGAVLLLLAVMTYGTWWLSSHGGAPPTQAPTQQVQP